LILARALGQLLFSRMSCPPPASSTHRRTPDPSSVPPPRPPALALLPDRLREARSPGDMAVEAERYAKWAKELRLERGPRPSAATGTATGTAAAAAAPKAIEAAAAAAAGACAGACAGGVDDGVDGAPPPADGAGLFFAQIALDPRQVFYASPAGLSLAIVNIKPLVPGHVLVIPR